MGREGALGSFLSQRKEDLCSSLICSLAVRGGCGVCMGTVQIYSSSDMFVLSGKYLWLQDNAPAEVQTEEMLLFEIKAQSNEVVVARV